MNATDKAFNLAPDSAKPEGWLDQVRSQVKSVRFGIVQIVIHDARVVQIEKTEKIRLDRTEAA